MRRTAIILKIGRALWVGISVFVLAVTLYAFDGRPDSDIGVFFAWCMLILSFPVGLLVPLVHVALFEAFSTTVENSSFSFVLDWVGFTMLGYLQWFVFVPYLIGKRRDSKSRKLGPEPNNL